MPIYVNTDNSDEKKKVFNASGLGSAVKIEAKMKEVVIKTLADQKFAADFDTKTPGKGYTLKLKVVAEIAGKATIYTVKIEILRYPPEKAKKGKGEAMVPITVTLGHATLEGASEADLLDAIGALTESAVKAAISPMKIDMARR